MNKASRKNEFSNYQSQAQPSRTRVEERRDDEDVIYVKLCHDSPEASSIWYVRTYFYFAPLLLPVKRRSSNCSTSLQLFSPFCPPRRSAGWNEERKKAAGLCNPARVVPLLVCPTRRHQPRAAQVADVAHPCASAKRYQ